MTENEKFLTAVIEMIRDYWPEIYTSIEKFTIPDIHFAIRDQYLDKIAREYIPGYEDGSMLICIGAYRMDLEFTDRYDPTAMENFFNTDEVVFFIFNERVEAKFDHDIVTDDTNMPSLLDILRECYVQKTANPVMKLD